MTPVKEILITLYGNDVIYKTEKEQGRILSEKRKEWNSLFAELKMVLALHGYTRKNCQFYQSENQLNITVSSDYSFENAVELLKQLETRYKVIEFAYTSEYDTPNNQKPFIRFYIARRD